MTPSSLPRSAAEHGAVPAERPTLLFVDDEPAILAALKVVFRRGYQVLTTTDGEEALQWLATRRVDVIVCDQRMPKITGVEVLSRARSVSPSTIRLLLTGYADNEAVLGAINDGEVHRFLNKPWDNTALRLSVEQAVAMSVKPELLVPTPSSVPSPPSPPSSPCPSPASPPSLPPSPQRAPAAPAARTPEPPGLVLPFPPHERALEREAREGEPIADAQAQRERVLIVERDGKLHGELSGTAGADFLLSRARDIVEASSVIEQQPARVIVFVLDAQSAFQRSFLKLLKIENPGVIVIAVCEALDTPHMIELINHARIFRFLRYPVSTPLLVRHLQSAAALARRLHEQPLLLGTQRVSLDAAESHALIEALRLQQKASAETPTHPHQAPAPRGWRQRLAAWLHGA
jgi:response regulator RpfG family c-di-GMP phosphodiesterase